MKKILFTILFLTSLTGLSAQLQDSFLLVGSAGTFSALTDSTFRGTVTFQTDQFGSGYLPTGIQTGYKLIDAKGDIFSITVVNSSNFTTANIDVEEDDADRTAPAGIVMVFAVLPSGLYPVAPVNSTGISPIMEARLHMANVITRGVGLDVGVMTDSLNTIRDSLAALEAELEAARTDSLNRIRDSINAVVSIPEKLPSQNITISAPSYTLRYDTINQHIVITENSQAYRSAGGNIVISSETGKTDIVGNELEINTDNITSFTARTSLNDDISGVIVENDAGQIRRTATLTPFTDSLAVTTITSIDLGYKYKARYKLNCASDPEIITLNLSNPIAGGVYTFRFFGVVDSITVAFSHKQDDETSKATFGVSDNSSKTFVFDSDGNYFLIPSGTTTTTTTTATGNYSVLDTIVTSADWNPLNTLLDDYNFISVTVQSESGDPSDAQFGLPTPVASLSDLEMYVHAWDEDGTRDPVISAGSGTLWYDSTSTSTSVSLLNGHTYRLHVDQTTVDSWIWVMIDLTRDYVGSGGGSGGIWEQENSNTLASNNTTDNYHQGNIGVGDFSATTIGAGLHILGGTNSSIRLSDTATTDSATLAYIDFYRGASTSQIGRFGFTNTGDADMYLRNVIASGGIVLQTNGLSKAKLFPTGQLQLLDYGSGTFSGTAAYNLQVDASGNIIETAAGGGGGGYWTQTGSDIYYNTGNIAVGTTTPNTAEILAKNGAAGSQIQVEATSGPAIITTNRTDGHWMSLFSTATGFGSGIFLKDSTEFTIAHANAVDDEDSKSFSTSDDILYIDSSGNVTTYKTFTPLGGLSGGPSVEADTFKISVDAGSNINVFFEDGDVTHPFTTYAPTNTSARITSSSSGKGGMNFLGFIEDEAGNDPAVKFTAYSEEDLTTGPAIFFSAYKSDGGTGRSDPSGSEILAAFGAGTNLKVEILANGGVRVNAGPMWLSGSGTPEGSVTAPVGSFYSRTDGGTGTSFYVKESGTGNTGWVAK